MFKPPMDSPHGHSTHNPCCKDRLFSESETNAPPRGPCMHEATMDTPSSLQWTFWWFRMARGSIPVTREQTPSVASISCDSILFTQLFSSSIHRATHPSLPPCPPNLVVMMFSFRRTQKLELAKLSFVSFHDRHTLLSVTHPTHPRNTHTYTYTLQPYTQFTSAKPQQLMYYCYVLLLCI